MFSVNQDDVLALEGGTKSIVEEIPWVGFGAELIGKEEEDYVLDALRNRKLCRITTKLSDSYCHRLEESIRELSGSPYVVAVNSCNSALHCAMVALNIGPGDEVLVSGAGWFSVATAVINVGAVPIPLECDESLTVDTDDIEPKITPRTKAIIVIHWRGLPANMDRIMEIAKRHNLKVVEDVAQAFGGTYKGKFLGTIGDVGCYSFNMHKIISAGEGGALAIKNGPVYKRAFTFSGMYNYYLFQYRDVPPKPGLPMLPMLNFRMPEICAAIACAQMLKLDSILSTLRTRHAELRNKVAAIEGLRFALAHDPEGECGYTIPLTFPTSEAADFFFNAMLAEGAINIATLKYSGFGGGEARGTMDLSKEFIHALVDIDIPVPNAYCTQLRETMGITVTADSWNCLTEHIGPSDKLDPWKLLNGPEPKLAEGVVPKTKERLNRVVVLKLNVMMKPHHIDLLAKAAEKVAKIMRERKMLW